MDHLRVEVLDADLVVGGHANHLDLVHFEELLFTPEDCFEKVFVYHLVARTIDLAKDKWSSLIKQEEQSQKERLRQGLTDATEDRHNSPSYWRAWQR